MSSFHNFSQQQSFIFIYALSLNFGSTMKRLTKDQWAEELVTETDKWVMDEINTANLEANLK